MNVRCFRCGWSFSVGRETITTALANASATGARHYDERCPRCRQVVKIPIDQLKRAVPVGQAPPAAEVQAVMSPPPDSEPPSQATEAASPERDVREVSPASPASVEPPVKAKRARKRGPTKSSTREQSATTPKSNANKRKPAPM